LNRNLESSELLDQLQNKNSIMESTSSMWARIYSLWWSPKSQCTIRRKCRNLISQRRLICCWIRTYTLNTLAIKLLSTLKKATPQLKANHMVSQPDCLRFPKTQRRATPNLSISTNISKCGMKSPLNSTSQPAKLHMLTFKQTTGKMPLLITISEKYREWGKEGRKEGRWLRLHVFDRRKDNLNLIEKDFEVSNSGEEINQTQFKTLLRN
jgi:hypothetical protein